MITDRDFLNRIIDLAACVRDSDDLVYSKANATAIIEHISIYMNNPTPKIEQDKNSLSVLCSPNVQNTLKELYKANSEKNPSIMKECVAKAINNVESIRNKLHIAQKPKKVRGFTLR